jgi:hypothetical protein
MPPAGLRSSRHEDNRMEYERRRAVELFGYTLIPEAADRAPSARAVSDAAWSSTTRMSKSNARCVSRCKSTFQGLAVWSRCGLESKCRA